MEIVSIILFIVVIFIVINWLVIIKPYEKWLVERLWKYIWTLWPWLNLIIPFIDRVVKVDLREKVIQTPSQEMITKDNAVVSVDAVFFAQIIDPVKATYEIENPFTAVSNLAMTMLRSIIWQMNLDDVLWERNSINIKVQTELSKETSKWWLRINKIEIQRIDPPEDLMNAMNKQKIAQQEKRALILKAEWEREAAIKKAEWIKEASILEAEWEKQAMILKAEWQAISIEKLALARAKALQYESEAAILYFKENAIIKEQLKVLEEALKNNTKYVLDTWILDILRKIWEKK